MSGKVIVTDIPTQTIKDLLESHYRALSIIDDGHEVEAIELPLGKTINIKIKLRSRHIKDEILVLDDKEE